MNTIPYPNNPIEAVTAPDPYPFYRQLTAKRPLYFDAALDLWVAASADAVTAILSDPACRVRPTQEPVPKTLIHSPAAEIFSRLVRMNDGQQNLVLKEAIVETLRAVQHLEERCIILAQTFDTCESISFQLPVCVMADLLGFPSETWPQIGAWVRDFVRCLSPLCSADEITWGKQAAVQLLEFADDWLSEGLFKQLLLQAIKVQINDSNVVAANAIGFITQAYEAAAGLIGNTLVCLARQPELLPQVRRDPALLRTVITEISRLDPSVQNTRRYVADDGTIAGQAMQAGDAILVLLAAANHDPAANGQQFAFGIGVHACPGERFATSIAYAGLTQSLNLLDNDALIAYASSFAYQPSINARIPIFKG